jgi:hypothetical protein
MEITRIKKTVIHEASITKMNKDVHFLNYNFTVFKNDDENLKLEVDCTDITDDENSFCMTVNIKASPEEIKNANPSDFVNLWENFSDK